VHPWIIAIIVIWSLPWKAAALWRAARRGHLGWFLILIVFNTLAILDILYPFVFSKWRIKKEQEAKPEQQTTQPAPLPSSTNKSMIV
jgi:hypothetical protein